MNNKGTSEDQVRDKTLKGLGTIPGMLYIYISQTNYPYVVMDLQYIEYVSPGVI